jgi:hypothetical protein
MNENTTKDVRFTSNPIFNVKITPLLSALLPPSLEPNKLATPRTRKVILRR